MRIEFSYKYEPTDHVMIEDVVSYTQTKNECLIFTAEGLFLVLRESDVEDFSVYGLGEES